MIMSDVAGFIGEKVELRFVERSRLARGQGDALPRASATSIRQLPPDSLSVSLNILALSPATDFCDQYRFDLESARDRRDRQQQLARAAGRARRPSRRRATAATSSSISPSGHPSERIRFAACEAQAMPWSRPRRARSPSMTSAPRKRFAGLRRRDGGARGALGSGTPGASTKAALSGSLGLERQPMGVEQGLGIARGLLRALEDSARAAWKAMLRSKSGAIGR